MAKTLPEKFFIKPDQQIAVINAPDRYLTDTLTMLPNGVTVTQDLEGLFDQIQYFLTTQRQIIEVIETLKAHLKEGGVLWLSYPKGGSKASIRNDVNRDILHDNMSAFGLDANHQIAIDDTWSALRFKVL